MEKRFLSLISLLVIILANVNALHNLWQLNSNGTFVFDSVFVEGSVATKGVPLMLFFYSNNIYNGSFVQMDTYEALTGEKLKETQINVNFVNKFTHCPNLKVIISQANTKELIIVDTISTSVKIVSGVNFDYKELTCLDEGILIGGYSTSVVMRDNTNEWKASEVTLPCHNSNNIPLKNPATNKFQFLWNLCTLNNTWFLLDLFTSQKLSTGVVGSFIGSTNNLVFVTDVGKEYNMRGARFSLFEILKKTDYSMQLFLLRQMGVCLASGTLNSTDCTSNQTKCWS